MKYCLTAFLLLCPIFLFAQKKGQSLNDSLLKELPKFKEDTSKVDILNTLCRNYLIMGKYDSAIKYGQKAQLLAISLPSKRAQIKAVVAYQNTGTGYFRFGEFPEAFENYSRALNLSKANEYKKGIADGYNNIGNYYKDQYKYQEALVYYDSSYKIKEELRDTLGLGNTAYNVANIYLKNGEHEKALKKYFLSLEMRKEIKDTAGIGHCYENIGLAYNYFGNYPEALKNELAALKIFERIGKPADSASIYGDLALVYENISNYSDALKYHQAALKIETKLPGHKNEVAIDYGNIGNIYLDLGQFSEALKNHQLALKIEHEPYVDSLLLGNSYSNIGNVYFNQGKFQDAFNYEDTALKIRVAIGDSEGMATSLGSIGRAQIKLNNFQVARKNLNDAISLSKEIGSKLGTRDDYSDLATLDSLEGNYKEAYEDYKLLSVYKDSLWNEDSTKKTVTTELQYVFDKQQDSIQLENEKKELEKEKEFQLKALIFEYEKKQAAAKSEKEKQALKFEEALKEKQIVYDAEKKQDSLKRVNDAESAKKEAQHKLDLAVANERNKQVKLFWILSVAAISSVSIAIYRVKIKNKNEQLDNESKTLTGLARAKLHNVGSNYNTIGLKTDGKEYDLVDKYVKASVDFIDRLIMNKPNWTLEDELISLEKFYSAEVIILKEVNISFNFDKSFDEDNTMFIPEIFTTFLHNSMHRGFPEKQGECSFNITVKKIEEKLLQVQVADNGIGKDGVDSYLSPTRQDHGLYILNERIKTELGKAGVRKKKINDIQIEGSSQTGTKITFEFPYETANTDRRKRAR